MSDLVLEIEAAKPPQPDISKVCGACSFYRPYRDPVTNRVHPSVGGNCVWTRPQFDWPMSYRKWGLGSALHDPVAFAIPVYAKTNASSCKCFKP